MFESAPNKANTPAEDRRSDGIGIGVGGEIHRYVSVYVCACVGKHHHYLGEAAKTVVLPCTRERRCTHLIWNVWSSDIGRVVESLTIYHIT